MSLLHELSLFSGYGGFSLGLRLAGLEVRTVGYVESEPYCQEIIKARIKDGFLDDGPIFPDICAFDGRQCRGVVDIVTAGFPCQPHSTAGQRRGEADERNLWPDTLRVIGEVGPRFVLLENVPGILANGYAGTVVGQLSELGYDAVWGLVPAAAVGAPHLRWRWWCLAYATSRREKPVQQCGPLCSTQQGSEDVAHTEGFTGTRRSASGAGQGRPPSCGASPNAYGEGQSELQGKPADAPSPGRDEPSSDGWWSTEPPVGRLVDGYPDRVGQLRALGNGVVPAVVAEFLKRVGA